MLPRSAYLSMKQAAEQFGRGDCKDPAEAMRVHCQRKGIPLERFTPTGHWYVLPEAIEEALKRGRKRRAS